MNRVQWLLQFAIAQFIAAALFVFPGFRAWFTSNPIDAMFTFGGLAFGLSGLKGILNPGTRVDRWSSGPTAIILTAYLVAYWHLGTFVSLASGAWGVFNWWFLFVRRYVGMEAKNGTV